MGHQTAANCAQKALCGNRQPEPVPPLIQVSKNTDFAGYSVDYRLRVN
jgi:hypothetical protein